MKRVHFLHGPGWAHVRFRRSRLVYVTFDVRDWGVMLERMPNDDVLLQLGPLWVCWR